jgi:hypothetical protein
MDPRYQQITLNPEDRKINYNKYFLQMQKMKVLWIHSMPGSIWKI